MLRRVAFAFAVVACAGAHGPTAPPRPVRVVLLSVDAGSDVILDRLLASGALRGGAFERMLARGAVAESLTPAPIASTPISHATMFSGAWPGQHGITSVSLPGAGIADDPRSGFTVPTAVDRLWTIAQRAGLHVVCLAAPGAEGISPETTCTETVPFGAIARAAAPVSGKPSPDEIRDLASRILAAAGPSPGEPEARLVTTGQMTEDEYVVRAERFADYVGNAVTMELARRDWDLLIAYMPIVDNLEHRYLITDPRQVEYAADGGARRVRFAGYITRGYRKVDAILSSWMKAAPDTTFVIVSDHGMIPTHSTVILNNVLAAAGLRVGGPDAQVRALSSGASAQVYVNSRRRFAQGVVADEDVSGIVAKVIAACRGVVDPVTGAPVFAAIEPSSAFGALHLEHANAGDVYVLAPAGWAISGRFDPAVPAIVPNTVSPDARQRVSRSPAEQRFLETGGLNELRPGVHGHRPGDPRMQAIFYAMGPSVPRLRAPTASMTDVAPTVLRLLNVTPPPFMSGRAVFAPQKRAGG